jgi:hypothetical protein
MNKKIIAWVVAALGVVLLASSIWTDLEKGPSAVRSFAIAAICIVVLAVLIRANVIHISDKRHIPFISPGPVLPNFVKALLCLILAGLWGYFGAILAKDTSSWLVVGAVMGPPVVLAIVGGWFVFKASGPG